MAKGNVKLYNHMFDMGFTITTTKKDPYKVTGPELITALEIRLRSLKDNIEKEGTEWAGFSDSYEV